MLNQYTKKMILNILSAVRAQCQMVRWIVVFLLMNKRSSEHMSARIHYTSTPMISF